MNFPLGNSEKYDVLPLWDGRELAAIAFLSLDSVRKSVWRAKKNGTNVQKLTLIYVISSTAFGSDSIKSSLS